nr:MAG TPA: hypothetical protein [Caudoviricetes sp.]
MIPIDRSLLAIVLAAAISRRGYWPARATGKHSQARRLRAAARRGREVRR